MLEFGLGVSKLASRGFGIKRIEVESIMTCSNPDEVEAGIPEPGSGHSFHDITVVVHDVKLVQPADATKEETMYLTNIDLTLVETVECFYVFLNNKDRSSENVFSVLEDALARLLVPYHFMAGRLEVNLEEERLQVKCNRAGAGFLVASSEQTVEELGDLKLVNPNFGKLVPAPPSDDIRPVDDFLLMVQVTRFRCGGFTVGFRHSHCVLDGLSAAQLYNSFGKVARGETLTVFPDLDRSVLRPRDPPAPEFAHPEYFDMSHRIPRGVGYGQYPFHISPSECITKHIPMSRMEIQMLQTIAMADGSIKRCSSFEATVAHFWQARTRSLHFEPHELTKLLITVDIRPKMQPPIPPTFKGNAVINAYVSAPAAEVVRQPLSFCVAQIQQAIAKIDELYVRSAVDWLEFHRGIPAIGSTKDVLVSAWSKLPLYELDFGWGKPVYAGPPSSGFTPDYVVIASNGCDDGGLLLLVSFRPHEMVKFEQYLRTHKRGNRARL